MPKQDRIPELVEKLRGKAQSYEQMFGTDETSTMMSDAAQTITDLLEVVDEYKEAYHNACDLRATAIEEYNELKAKVKRLKELRDKALKRLCDWCGVCPEEKRDPMDCDDIARLGEVSEDA